MVTKPALCIYEFGSFRLDVAKRILMRNGEIVGLTPKCLDILLVLVESGGAVLSKDELMQRVWPDSFVEENNLTYNISVLRKALGEKAADHHYIVTIPGIGYRFVAEVREVHEKADEVAGENPIPPLPSRRGTTSKIILAVVFLIVSGILIYWLITRPPQPPPVAMVKSIAVLPFQPLGEQNRNEMLGIELADSLITKLSKIKQLTVRPMSAVLKYAGGEQDAVTIGRTLQVDAVLESRVQQVGDHLKINSQLVRVEDGKVIWSFQCDDKCDNILTLQESVSESITRELKFNLTSEEQKLLTKRYTDNAEVYQLYLNGRAEWHKRTREANEKAIDYFQQALTHEPNYAPAYSGLADCYIRLASSFSAPPRGVLPKAKYAAARAIAIDDKLAEAHASLGQVLFLYEWKFVDANREFERAIELDPNYAIAHLRYAQYLTAIGHHEEAIREARLACELDPTAPDKRGLLGYYLYAARQYDEAIEQEKKAQELGGQPAGYRYAALIQLGRYEEAVNYALEAEARAGEKSEKLDELKRAFQSEGINGFWRKEVEQLSKATREKGDRTVDLAHAHSYLGDKDKAFAYLGKMIEERRGPLFLQVEPCYDSLRSDPRYADLLRRIGFPQEY